MVGLERFELSYIGPEATSLESKLADATVKVVSESQLA